MQIYRAAIWTVTGCLAVLVLALVYTIGYVSNDGGNASARGEAPSGNGAFDGSGDANFDTLSQIVELLRRDYLGREQLDEAALYEAAIRGMLDSLSDSGTYYVDPSTLLRRSSTGSFEGIGATVSQQNNQIVIIRPYPNSPAEAAGVQAGDVIIAVDGESTEGWSVDEAVLRIRGEKGTEVTIGVQRLDGSTAEFTITRDEVQVDSVTTTPPAGVLRDSSGDEVTDIAYIRISEFTERTPSEVLDAISDVESSGASGLIIDVRVNGGGLLIETVDTTDMFLNEGTILIEQDRDNNENVYAAKEGGPATNIPIVVLADEFSASGAEVLTAALQDNGRATVIGETTYGKGTVNIPQPLEDGGALYVTVRHWLTPDRIQIENAGITPDIYIAPGPLDPGYDPENDRQLFAAIDTLRGETVASDPRPTPTPTGQ
jgi:carboxyl-terminal processing protease